MLAKKRYIREQSVHDWGWLRLTNSGLDEHEPIVQDIAHSRLGSASCSK